MESSQVGRQRRDAAALMPPNNVSPGKETMASICQGTLKSHTKRARDIGREPTQMSILHETGAHGRITRISQSEANRVIRAEVEACIARVEPIDRMLHPHARATIITRHLALD